LRPNTHGDCYKNKSAALTQDLAANLASPLQPTNFGSGLGGTTKGDRGQLYRVRAMQSASGGKAQLRRGVSEYLVTYEQLNSTLQRLNQRGSRIVDISCA
jgi:phycocyanin-associated rod linker protein